MIYHLPSILLKILFKVSLIASWFDFMNSWLAFICSWFAVSFANNSVLIVYNFVSKIFIFSVNNSVYSF